jgi:hypothetical protein
MAAIPIAAIILAPTIGSAITIMGATGATVESRLPFSKNDLRAEDSQKRDGGKAQTGLVMT